MKIKIKRFKAEDGFKVPMPQITKKGDWIDLYSFEDVNFSAPQSGTLKKKTVNGTQEKYRDVSFDIKTIKLGIAMQLPSGYEAILANRSSTGKGIGISIINGMGIIDNSFCGSEDQWRYPAIAWKRSILRKETPFCQFRIQLSQKATLWQKIKWLFDNKIEFVEQDSLSSENRGGGCIRVENN